MNKLILNKPISKIERSIARKCKWKNVNDIPVRKNILPEGYISKYNRKEEPITIGTTLNRYNFSTMEHIMGNNKLFNSQFIKTNLTDILKMSETPRTQRLVKALLTPETIDKIETQRRLVKRNPKAYIQDKDIIKYINTPAGLNSVFADVNILKAAATLNEVSLDKLFKMDITTGQGKKMLEVLGEMNESNLMALKHLSSKHKDNDVALISLEYMVK